MDTRIDLGPSPDYATDRRRRRMTIEIMFGRWCFCPTTGRVLDILPGDDKVLCNCRTSNPVVPAESTDQTGTHIVHFCRAATADDWLDQYYADNPFQAPS